MCCGCGVDVDWMRSFEAHWPKLRQLRCWMLDAGCPLYRLDASLDLAWRVRIEKKRTRRGSSSGSEEKKLTRPTSYCSPIPPSAPNSIHSHPFAIISLSPLIDILITSAIMLSSRLSRTVSCQAPLPPAFPSIACSLSMSVHSASIIRLPYKCSQITSRSNMDSSLLGRESQGPGHRYRLGNHKLCRRRHGRQTATHNRKR